MCGIVGIEKVVDGLEHVCSRTKIFLLVASA